MASPKDGASSARDHPPIPMIAEGDALAGHDVIAIDGQPNLVIVDKDTPQRAIIRKARDKDTGQEYCRFALWSGASVPILHRRFVRVLESGQDVVWDTEIAGDRHNITGEDRRLDTWVGYFPSLTGTENRGAIGQYKTVMQQLAALAPCIMMFDAPGLHAFSQPGEPDRYGFVWPDGRVTSSHKAPLPETTIIDTDGAYTIKELDAWAKLPMPPPEPTKARQQEAYNLIKGLSARGQPLISFTHSLLAPFTGIKAPNFSLGHALLTDAKNGSGKTSLAGFARSCLSPLIWNGQSYEADASFDDTTSSVETATSRRRHLPCLLDDWKSGLSAGEERENVTKTDRLVRSLHDRRPVRRRMTSKLKKQQEYILENTLFGTMEKQSPLLTEGLLRRALIIPLHEDELRKRGPKSLETTSNYYDVTWYWGYRAVQYVVDSIACYGYETFATDVRTAHINRRRLLDQAIRAEWARTVPHVPFPYNGESVITLAASEWLAFSYWQLVSAAEMSDSDIVPYLVSMACHQLRVMIGLRPDDEEGPLFERALIGVFDEIAQGKLLDRQRCRIVRHIKAPRPLAQPVSLEERETAPALHAAEGAPFTSGQWGWQHQYQNDDSDREQVANLPRDIAYAEITLPARGAAPSQGRLYLTGDFRQAMLDWLRRHHVEGAPDSEIALSKLAERENWIVARDETGKTTKKITQHGARVRCWAIDLGRALSLLGIPEQEQAPPPSPLSPDDTRHINEVLAALDEPAEEITQAQPAGRPCTFADDCGQAGEGYTATGVWLCRQCATTLDVRLVS